MLWAIFASCLISACAEKPPLNEKDFYTPVPVTVPEGYSVLYLYRGQEAWTQQQLSRLYLNQRLVATLSDSTYTTLVVSPGNYTIVSAPWKFYRHFYIAPNHVYYLDFQLETILFPQHPPQNTQFIKIDNTRYLTGQYLFKSNSAAKPDLSACRYVKPKNNA